jgi:hypothetical protein
MVTFLLMGVSHGSIPLVFSQRRMQPRLKGRLRIVVYLGTAETISRALLNAGMISKNTSLL